MVRAALVPDGDVAFLPLPAHLDVRIIDTASQPLEEAGALVRVHADDRFHEHAGDEQRLPTGDRMHACERMLSAGEDVAELGELIREASSERLPERVTLCVP